MARGAAPYFVPPRPKPELSYLFEHLDAQRLESMRATHVQSMEPVFRRYRVVVKDTTKGPGGTRAMSDEEMAAFEKEHPNCAHWAQGRANVAWKAECQELLKKTMANKHAKLFVTEVPKDPSSDYHVIIKKPMCLEGVKADLEGGVIDDPNDFIDAVRLVFYNCFHYHPEKIMSSGKPMTNLFWKEGKLISQFFEERVEKMRGDAGTI